MSKVKYRFNTKSLTYEKAKVTSKEVILRVLSYLATGTVFAVITIFLANNEKEFDRKKMNSAFSREVYEYDIQSDTKIQEGN